MMMLYLWSSSNVLKRSLLRFHFRKSREEFESITSRNLLLNWNSTRFRTWNMRRSRHSFGKEVLVPCIQTSNQNNEPGNLQRCKYPKKGTETTVCLGTKWSLLKGKPKILFFHLNYYAFLCIIIETKNSNFVFCFKMLHFILWRILPERSKMLRKY